MQSVGVNFIKKSLELLGEQQKEIQDSVTSNPLDAMNEIAENNLKMWQDMQEGFFKAAGLNSDKK